MGGRILPDSEETSRAGYSYSKPITDKDEDRYKAIQHLLRRQKPTINHELVAHLREQAKRRQRTYNVESINQKGGITTGKYLEPYYNERTGRYETREVPMPPTFPSRRRSANEPIYSDPNNAGLMARQNGKSIVDCPFKDNTKESDAWLRGYGGFKDRA
jgi:hypothetical protein